MTKNFYEEWVNKKAKISIISNRYYKGKVLAVDESFLKFIDFKGHIVYIRLDHIIIIEEWVE